MDTWHVVQWTVERHRPTSLGAGYCNCPGSRSKQRLATGPDTGPTKACIASKFPSGIAQTEEDSPMGCDSVVALGRATSDAHAIFGQNNSWPAQQSQSLSLTPKLSHAVGEQVKTEFLELSQARRSFAVLG